jgi:hypothetical protein
MSRVGALRSRSGTSSVPNSSTSAIASFMATYTALLFGAHARYTTAVAIASSPSGVPMRS